MSRDPESLLAEADYWKAALEDMQAINRLVAETAERLVGGPVALLEYMTMPEAVRSVAPVAAIFGDSLRSLERLLDALNGLIDLAGGRAIALRRELGLEE